MMVDRIFTAFHETFALSCGRLGQITPDVIRSETSLGPNYIKAMPRYARGCGLMEMGSYKLTPLGEAVYRRDPNLTHPVTLWLMHYHLSAPHGPGPAFWSHLVTHCLPFGEVMPTRRLTARLTEFLSEDAGVHSIAER